MNTAAKTLQDASECISNAERQRRLTATRNARANVALEGFELPPECDAVDARYVAGELTPGQYEDEYMRIARLPA